MSRVCQVSGAGPMKGHRRRHPHSGAWNLRAPKTNHTFLPNLQTVTVNTPEGKVRLKVPVGTQSHKILRVKGKGLHRLGSYGTGDQLVRIVVETPSKLTHEQKELLKKFDEIGANACHPMHNQFFEKVKNFFG